MAQRPVDGAVKRTTCSAPAPPQLPAEALSPSVTPADRPGWPSTGASQGSSGARAHAPISHDSPTPHALAPPHSAQRSPLKSAQGFDPLAVASRLARLAEIFALVDTRPFLADRPVDTSLSRRLASTRLDDHRAITLRLAPPAILIAVGKRAAVPPGRAGRVVATRDAPEYVALPVADAVPAGAADLRVSPYSPHTDRRAASRTRRRHKPHQHRTIAHHPTLHTRRRRSRRSSQPAGRCSVPRRPHTDPCRPEHTPRSRRSHHPDTHPGSPRTRRSERRLLPHMRSHCASSTGCRRQARDSPTRPGRPRRRNSGRTRRRCGPGSPCSPVLRRRCPQRQYSPRTARPAAPRTFPRRTAHQRRMPVPRPTRHNDRRCSRRRSRRRPRCIGFRRHQGTRRCNRPHHRRHLHLLRVHSCAGPNQPARRRRVSLRCRCRQRRPSRWSRALHRMPPGTGRSLQPGRVDGRRPARRCRPNRRRRPCPTSPHGRSPHGPGRCSLPQDGPSPRLRNRPRRERRHRSGTADLRRMPEGCPSRGTHPDRSSRSSRRGRRCSASPQWRNRSDTHRRHRTKHRGTRAAGGVLRPCLVMAASIITPPSPAVSGSFGRKFSTRFDTSPALIPAFTCARHQAGMSARSP
jgi:hypothetical protein